MFARLRWFIIALLFVGGAISYLDRAALSIAAPMIAKDFELDPSQLGIVFSQLLRGLCAVLLRRRLASDRIGPKNVFTIAMTVWSVFCGLTAATVGIASLLVVRVVFGMGEGPFSSTANKLVSNWFPRREQASAVGIANAGQPIGAALAGPVVGPARGVGRLARVVRRHRGDRPASGRWAGSGSRPTGRSSIAGWPRRTATTSPAPTPPGRPRRRCRSAPTCAARPSWRRPSPSSAMPISCISSCPGSRHT